MMAIRFSPGEGALGAEEAPPVRPGKRSGTALPSDVRDARIAKLEERVSDLEEIASGLIEDTRYLSAELARVNAERTQPVHAVHAEAACTPKCVHTEPACTQLPADTVPVDRKTRNAAAMRERRAAKKAGVSVAELRQQQAIAASPDNVVALKPRGASTTAPTLDAPAIAVA